MKRSLLLSAIGGVLLLLCILVAAAVWIPHRFLSNDAFRQEMNRQTRVALNVDGEWMPFRLDGWTLRSEGYEGSGTFSGHSYHIRAEQVSFKIKWRALLQRKWQIDPIAVQKLDIQVAAQKKTSATAPPVPRSSAPSFPKIALLFIPQTVDIKEIMLAEASVAWSTKDLQTYHMAGIQAKSIPNGAGGWSTSITRGTFTPPERSPWNLNSARLTGDLQQMELHHSEWFGAESGVIKISGPLMRAGTVDADLAVEGRNIPATAVAPAAWKSFLEGSLDSDATARINSSGLTVKGEATGKNIRLIGVPMLRSMSLATGLREWTELPLQTAWVKFEYAANKLTIPSSALESENMLRLEGNLSVYESQLSGTYQVGLAPRVASRIPGATLAVFTLNQNGYHWAQPPMILSGTTEDPKEDLSPRLKTAIFDAVEEKIQKGVSEGLNLLDGLLRSVR